MGSQSYATYAEGDVARAYERAVDRAAYDSGHGTYSGTITASNGYVCGSHSPMSLVEAEALAEQLLDGHGLGTGEAAYAIPVVAATREIEVADVSYTPDPETLYTAADRNLLAAIEPLISLRRGEMVRAARVLDYTAASSRLGTRAPRTGCRVVVTINKPPMTRVMTVSVEVPGTLTDPHERRAAIFDAAQAKLRLRAGEKVVGNPSILSVTPARTKVTAVACKGATETRYVIKGHQGEHSTWETGFVSQADARAWAADFLGTERAQVLYGTGAVTLEIESVTRRASGEPLVQVSRTVGKYIAEVDVTVLLAGQPTQTEPDGWLFVGWAPC